MARERRVMALLCCRMAACKNIYVFNTDIERGVWAFEKPATLILGFQRDKKVGYGMDGLVILHYNIKKKDFSGQKGI